MKKREINHTIIEDENPKDYKRAFEIEVEENGIDGYSYEIKDLKSEFRYFELFGGFTETDAFYNAGRKMEYILGIRIERGI